MPGERKERTRCPRSQSAGALIIIEINIRDSLLFMIINKEFYLDQLDIDERASGLGARTSCPLFSFSFLLFPIYAVPVGT
jgi:hypothetical protein